MAEIQDTTEDEFHEAFKMGDNEKFNSFATTVGVTTLIALLKDKTNKKKLERSIKKWLEGEVDLKMVSNCDLVFKVHYLFIYFRMRKEQKIKIVRTAAWQMCRSVKLTFLNWLKVKKNTNFIFLASKNELFL
jgi:hypothetical protein